MSSASSSSIPDSRLHEELASRSLSSTVGESLLYVFIMSLGTIGNVAVLLVLYRNHRLRNIPAYFVISLAISDIVMLDLCGPFLIAVLILGRWIFGDPLCQFQGFVVILVACASLVTLASVAVNRYFHIVKNSKYRAIYTPTKAKLIVVGGWLVALIIPLTYIAVGKRYVFQPGKLFCFMELSKFTLPVLPSYIIIALSMVVLVVCYLSVFKALRVHEKTVARNLRAGNTRQAVLSLEDIKVTKILFATVVGFLLCWIPVFVIDSVDVSLGTGLSLSRGTYFAYTIFGATSSAINPIIYGVMNRSYRKAYLELFGIHRCRRVGDAPAGNINERDPRCRLETQSSGTRQHIDNRADAVRLLIPNVSISPSTANPPNSFPGSIFLPFPGTNGPRPLQGKGR